MLWERLRDLSTFWDGGGEGDFFCFAAGGVAIFPRDLFANRQRLFVSSYLKNLRVGRLRDNA